MLTMRMKYALNHFVYFISYCAFFITSVYDMMPTASCLSCGERTLKKYTFENALLYMMHSHEMDA